MSFLPVISPVAYGAGAYGSGPYGGSPCPLICIEVDVTNDPTNPTRVWTDITSLVRSASWTRSGRNDELQQSQTGNASLTCNNRSDALTSLGVRRSQWLRIRASWEDVTYARWQGIIEAAPRQWPHAGKDATVTIRASGIFKILRLYDLDGETFAAQRNDERVSALATLVGLTTGTIDTGTDDADAVVTPITQGTDALSTLLAIEQSENGLAVEDPDGTLSFQGRHYRLLNSSSSLATFGETTGEIPYTDSVSYQDDDVFVFNQVSVTPLGGSALVADNTDSQATEWTRRLNRSLVSSDAGLALSAAQYLANKYGDPSERIPSVTVQLPRVGQLDASLVSTLLAAVNSDRFTWTRAASTPISDDVFVEQVSESVVVGKAWDMTLQLSPAADEIGWLAATAGFSEAATTTRAVY